MKMTQRKGIVALVLIFSLYLGTIAPLSVLAQRNPTSGRAITNKDKTPMNVNTGYGFQLRLSEGEEGAEKRSVAPQVKTDPLSQGETENLYKRLPAIKSDPDDKQEFAKRIGSLAAPRTGQTIPQKFPQPEQQQSPNVNKGALEVLRFQPTGEVPIVPEMSVTFSQPMVAVTSQEQAAQTVPVELTPGVQGNWRWLGTKTILFDAKTRFPMATKYTAKIPAGTKSATGGALKKDVTWTFSTPTPTVKRKYPEGGPYKRDMIMFVAFDQAINAEAVLKTIKVTGGGKPLIVRLASKEEMDKEGLIWYSQEAGEGRWLAFRAIDANGKTENALPGNSAINIQIGPGTPSAEGPLTTKKADSFSFRTFGPLQLVDSRCGYNNRCSPFDDWYVQFTNPLNYQFDRKQVKIEPDIPNLKVYPSGNYLYFQGFKPGRKTYKVTIDGTLKDVFGQTLEKSATVTFNVGIAPRSLSSQGGAFITIDPTSKPAYSVYSINHDTLKLQMYAVTPENWGQFKDYMQKLYYEEDKRPQPPGRLLKNETIKVQSKPDELTETRIDLAPALNDGFGHVVLIIEPTIRENKYDRTRIVVWTQVTQIGLDAFVDNTELVGWATSLKDGRPLSGVEMAIVNPRKPQQKAHATKSFFERLLGWKEDEDTNLLTEYFGFEAQGNRTNAEGIVRFALPEQQSDRQSVLIARRGKDVSILPEQSDYWWDSYTSWYKRYYSDSLRWYVFDDRKIYRPKEEVSIKGWIRKITGGKFGDVTALGDGATGINYTVRDARNNEITKGKVNMNAFGGFDFKFKIPDNMNLGNAIIQLEAENGITGWQYQHQFQVEEFRRPEFEVTATTDTPAPHLVGTSANVSIEAKYYAGGALANAEVNWNVRGTPTNYTPPNRWDFTFGKWIPWWRYYEGYDGGNAVYQNFKGVTGGDGKHRLKMDFVSVNPPRPYSIVAEGTVTDVNRQAWTSSTTLLVHPSEVYVGIRTPRTFTDKGKPIIIEAIVTDIDGNALPDRDVTIKAVLKDWSFDKGQWKQETVDEQTCNLKSTNDVIKCEMIAKAGGVYTITATVMDDRERKNESEFTVWVSGGKTPPKRNVEQEEAQLIPDKKDYAPGDVAEILVQSPFVPAEGTLTLRRNGLIEEKRFKMNEPSYTLKIPIEEKYLPNIYTQVDLVGASPRTDDSGNVNDKLPKRPAFASGNLNLSISVASRKLSVKAEPEIKTLEPGGNTDVNIEVKDSSGQPVANSELAVVVVDESVLALTGYRVPDPLSIFYTARSADVTDYHSRKDVLLANPDDLKLQQSADLYANQQVAAEGMLAGRSQPAPAPKTAALKKEARKDGARDEDDASGQQQAIKLRENFNALAVFAPNVKTDADGRATIQVKLPDNLTRYRVTAVSVDSTKRFGSGESSITARQPLMVRPSAPRFLNFGDKFEMPVVVQNQTDNPMTVDVAVRATNAELTAGEGRRVVVPANDRVEVRFPVSTVKAGTARFQYAVSSGKWSDAAELSLPVWTPATTEAFATYGQIDNGAIVQPVQAPGDVFSQFGGLEVSTSSTQLQELTDAVIYLYTYRFACSEQIASRMMSLAALRDVLQAFNSKDIPTPQEMREQVKSDIEILKKRQNDNGSFGFWKRNEDYEWPFLTIHVIQALGLAKAKGYQVPQEMLDKGNNYLKNIESHIPKWYSKESRWAIVSYALYVRAKAGDKDIKKAHSLIQTATLDKLSFESIGWLYFVMTGDQSSTVWLDAIRKLLNNRVTETAGMAHFVTSYEDGAYVLLASDRRADGIILEALIGDQPNSDLIPKIVRGLLAHRTKGRWASTQENIFILVALDRYFNTYEKVTPDFIARAWLGQTYAGEQMFKGRTTDTNLINIPMTYLLDQNGSSNLILSKEGAGRLYYRIGMKYAPKNLKLEAADYGFTVLRTYEAVDDKDDVKRNADGSWTIKSGARVRVRVTMVAPTRRYHVALVDPLPAGLEALNPDLKTTGSLPPDTGRTGVLEESSQSFGYGWWRWRGVWYEHENLRDERAEAFSSLLWQGVWNYSYVARATTPGQFVVPPAKAEEMYAPETFGRSASDFVKVE
jgi:hypothetical protein